MIFQIPLGNLRGVGSLDNFERGSGGQWVNVIFFFVNIISSIIGVLTVSGALWFIVQLFTGAVSLISSGSDKQAVENARKKIIHALIGLGLLVGSFTIIMVVSWVFGINLFRLGNLIVCLGPQADPNTCSNTLSN